MKKLAEKCLFMVVALAVLLFLFCEIYRCSGTERKTWILDGTEKFHPVPNSVNVAVFGASHGATDLRTGPEGYDFFNFAIGSQSPWYDLALMHQYEENMEENTLVVLTVTYLSPYWNETETEFKEKQGRYYRLLDPENIIDVDLVQYYLFKLFPVLGVEPIPLINRFLLPIKKTEPTLSLDEVEKGKKERGFQHWSNIKRVFPKAAAWDIYEEIFSHCEENHWRVVLVTPPYTEYYNECFPAEFYSAFFDTVNRLAEEHGVLYFDYSHEEKFATATQWYRDLDHLNAEGAKVFEAQFYGDLKAAGLL